MSSAWLLPEHIADVLPSEARRIEELRRGLLDRARSYGFELVMPPLLEHLESLLSGTGQALGLQTFKLVDQLSGRTLGLRADTTPQVARIDAHLLNRRGVTRLCYSGPVVHTRPSGLAATREPLQFGAEVYGHAGLEADLEVVELAIDCLRSAGVSEPLLDLGDARVLAAVIADVRLGADELDAVVAALSAKDGAALAASSQSLPAAVREGLALLPRLYGGDEVLALARDAWPGNALLQQALQDLTWLTAHVRRSHPEVRVAFDLADMSGYAYYSGVRFSVFGAPARDALVRGGRYDEVGAVFGRRRPAVGFSLDLKSLAAVALPQAPRAAIRAPWGEDPGLRDAVRRLREQGETVVCSLPGHEHEGEEFDCDRELVPSAGAWALRAL